MMVMSFIILGKGLNGVIPFIGGKPCCAPGYLPVLLVEYGFWLEQ